MKTCLQKKLQKQKYYINHKNNKINNGNEKQPKKDKITVTV